MSQIHYFQRYSQQENVVTNNTLLLFSRLYNYSPVLFDHFLEVLLDDIGINLKVGVEFTQQTRGKNSVPDGMIKQNSFSILIEAKRGKNSDIKQLISHISSFGNVHTKVLVSLGTEKANISSDVLTTAGVRFVDTTYKAIIASFRNIIDDNRDYEMSDLIDDYEDFCNTAGLLPVDKHKLLSLPSGSSFDLNKKYGICFVPASRRDQPFSYLGLYKDKAIMAIGKLANILDAYLVEGELKITNNTNEVTTKQKQRIKAIIRDVQEKTKWDISRDHKFLLVEKFHETNFKKNSPGGARGKRYFNLAKTLELEELPTIKELAELLKDKPWK